MNRRTLNRILLVLLTVCCLAALCSCGLLGSSGSTGGNTGKSGGSGKTVYNVTLHLDKELGFSIYDFVDKETFIIKKPTTTPVKEGYVFVKWCSDEDCTTELEYGSKLTSNLDIYADWTKKKQTLTLVDDVSGAEDSTLLVEYGDRATLPSRLAAGYDFLGWFSDSNCATAFDATQAIRDDMTLYAGWAEHKYPIYYVTNGGTLATNAPSDYTMLRETNLPDCTKEGYEFIGWFGDDEYSGEAYLSIAAGQQGEKRFYAKFLCELTEAEAKGSATIADDTVSFGITYQEKTLNIEEYVSFSDGATYVILQDGRQVTLSFDENEGDEILTFEYVLRVVSENKKESRDYALVIKQYSSNYLEVTYHNNGEVYGTDPEVLQGMQARRWDAPTASAGYDFLYWSTSEDGEEFDFDTILEQNIDLYAVYEAIEYNITYSLGTGKNSVSNTATYTVRDAVVFADALPPSGGYDFEGWYTDAAFTQKVTGLTLGSTGDVKLYAAYSLETETILDFSGRTEISLAELEDYFRYAVYYRMTELSFVLTGGTPGTTVGSHLVAANDATNVDGGERTMNYYSDLTADEDGKWDMTTYTVKFTYKSLPSETSDPSVHAQSDPAEVHFSASGRAEDYNDFAIEHILTTLTVTDTEQLVYAVEHGYRPVPQVSSVAEEVYEQAKEVLRTYVDDDMTDYQKALAIYEYIARYVSYDHAIYDDYTSGRITADEAGSYYSFYLEGVFLNYIAVCDGYSKAYMLMCRMEGIPAVQIEGKDAETEVGHAWNKIYLSVNNAPAAWYVVDCTSGDTLVGVSKTESKEMLAHAYFLNTDVEMATRYTEGDGEFDYNATGVADYYALTEFVWNETEYTFAIDSHEEMAAFLSYLISLTGQKQITLDLEFVNGYLPFTYGVNEEINGLEQEIINGVGSTIGTHNISWVLSSGNKYIFLCSRK